MEIIGQQVTHSIFGAGQVMSVENGHITIKFSQDEGEKKFSYPEVFENHLEMEDKAAQKYVLEERKKQLKKIAADREQKEEKRLKAEEERVEELKQAKAAAKKKTAKTKAAATKAAATKKKTTKK